MFVFTSKREKKLWISAAIVLATIYTTLGLARTLVGLIPDRSVIDNLFMFGLLLIVASVVALGIQNKSSKIEIGVAFGVIGVYLIVFLRMTIPEERSHLIEYGILALFIYEALGERNKNGESTINPILLAIIITTIAGTIDECLQWFIPNRVFSFLDILFNFTASIMAVFGAWSMSWARSKTNSNK